MSTSSQAVAASAASIERNGDGRRRPRLERLFEDLEWPDRRVFLEARRAARRFALEVYEADQSGADAASRARLAGAWTLFATMRAELTAAPGAATALARALEAGTGISLLSLAREVLRAPELLTVSPTEAIETQLTMLTVLAPLRSASLWMVDETGQIQCTRHVGEGTPTRGAKQVAQAVIAGDSEEHTPRRLLIGLPVGRWPKPIAALVGSAQPGMGELCQSFLSESVSLIAAVLERDALLAANAASERALVETSERKLTRLGFDLHDGPIQDVAVCADDVRHFREELDEILDRPAQRKLVRGRLKALESQLVTIDVDLRRISNEVRAASILLNRPFVRAVRDLAKAFAARTKVEPTLELGGDMSTVSASQQIALLNIIHEALANIREHSNATAVEIVVCAGADGVEAKVVDNGCGFDLEPTLSRAAREGRLGLVAMHERVRLLGGQCRIESRLGGPTLVAVAIERWEPIAQASA